MSVSGTDVDIHLTVDSGWVVGIAETATINIAFDDAVKNIDGSGLIGIEGVDVTKAGAAVHVTPNRGRSAIDINFDIACRSC